MAELVEATSPPVGLKRSALLVTSELLIILCFNDLPAKPKIPNGIFQALHVILIKKCEEEGERYTIRRFSKIALRRAGIYTLYKCNLSGTSHN